MDVDLPRYVMIMRRITPFRRVDTGWSPLDLPNRMTFYSASLDTFTAMLNASRVNALATKLPIREMPPPSAPPAASA